MKHLLNSIALSVLASAQLASAGSRIADMKQYPNPTGKSQSFSTNGGLDTRNPFFQSLGSNGRSCITCHQPDQGWTVTPRKIRQRFDATGGQDPIFRTNDGSVSPLADVSTVKARRQAFRMLLTKGLIRIGIGIPANAEFELAAVDDPYGYASSNELSLFRRPLPSTNLRFLTTVMWDGRESAPNADLQADLIQQALDATQGHAQLAGSLSQSQLNDIVNFEIALTTAQVSNHKTGQLDADGARGGPILLQREPFFVGINDPLGGNPSGAEFNPVATTLFDAWAQLPPNSGMRGTARAAVARGEQLFNSRVFSVTNVAGLNDRLNMPVIQATCTLCHDAPNVGNHSVGLPLDLGLSDASRRTPDMPLYTLRNKTTGELKATTDPGRALITGQWSDIGKMKGPILRAVAARGPYFHNGSAATLADVVDFYNTRFNIHLTGREKSDLIAFLQSL